MFLSAQPYRLSRGARLLAIILAVGVGLQGTPMQSLVHHINGPDTHQECAHANGFCPMNPDGPCECNHTETKSNQADEPSLTTCNSGDSPVATVTTPRMWIGELADGMPAPAVKALVYRPQAPLLFSQRTGDEIFHPPRVLALSRRA